LNLIIALEHRFFRTPDGSYWSATIYPRPFWSRYLGVFDRLSILARVHDAPRQLDSWRRVDGDRVSFAPIPAYVGPWAFVQSFRSVRSAIQRAGLDQSAVLLRVPGMVASVASSCLQPAQPYGVEVVGDPYDVFSRHASSHPLRPFFRWWFTRSLKRLCGDAACSLYLTEHALQDRYPAGTWKPSWWRTGMPQGHLSVIASESDLQDGSFVQSIAEPSDSALASTKESTDIQPGRRFRLIFVGNLEALYKAPDVLVTAFARCVGDGLNGELVIIGDGRERPRIEGLVQRLRIGDRVTFLGQLAGGDAVSQQLDSSDLFVLPSRQEGLPKAMIEAMARGLPCIGASVGGIPELLPEIALVPRDDVDALAAKILQFARDPKLRLTMARMNLAAARRYHESLLQPKRILFYERLRALTEAWQRVRGMQA
jgi:glycosyltransferase involved in cell wall biosynthesis